MKKAISILSLAALFAVPLAACDMDKHDKAEGKMSKPATVTSMKAKAKAAKASKPVAESRSKSVKG